MTEDRERPVIEGPGKGRPSPCGYRANGTVCTLPLGHSGPHENASK